MPPFYNINTDSPPLLLLNMNCHSLTHLLSKIKPCRAKIHFSGALHSKQSLWILLNSFPVDRRSCRISVVAVPQEFWVAAPVVASEVCVLARELTANAQCSFVFPGSSCGHFTSTGAWIDLVYFTSSSLYFGWSQGRDMNHQSFEGLVNIINRNNMNHLETSSEFPVGTYHSNTPVHVPTGGGVTTN